MKMDLRARVKRLNGSQWRNYVTNEGIEIAVTISRKPWRYAVVAAPRLNDETRRVMLEALERKRIIREHNIRKLKAYSGRPVHLERIDGGKKLDVVSTPGEVANALFQFLIGRAQHQSRVEWLREAEFSPNVIKWTNDTEKAKAVTKMREKEGWMVIALDIWRE